MVTSKGAATSRFKFKFSFLSGHTSKACLHGRMFLVTKRNATKGFTIDSKKRKKRIIL